MKILITGSDGFIAKNLIMELKNRNYGELLLCNRKTKPEELEQYIEQCEVLIHLAGVNRPSSEDEYYIGNVKFTEHIVNLLKEKQKTIHIIYTSTVMNSRHITYRRSKQEAEKILNKYARQSNSRLSIYRLSNVFGKWCRPNYNSVVATFCYRISHDQKIVIDDPNARINLIYVDDVVESIISCIDAKDHLGVRYIEVKDIYQTTVGEVGEILLSFRQAQRLFEIPSLEMPMRKKLYSTYLSYMEPEKYCHELKMNTDERGAFTELLHSRDFGQVSVNIVKPGKEKGNHWHHTKVEKFFVVEGTALIKLCHMITGQVVDFIVSGEKMKVVDIPPGYTHSIANIGTEDLVTVMWANEIFDQEKPDTYYEKVSSKDS